MVSTNRGIIGGAWNAADAVDDGGPGGDRTEGAVTCPVHGDSDIMFIILLVFECDRDTVGEVEGGIVVAQLTAVTEESDVLEGEELGVAFGRVRDFTIFTGTHGEEECTHG